MTAIGSSSFNISAFQKLGIEVSGKKMTDEEIERFKKIQETFGTMTTEASGGAQAIDPAAASNNVKPNSNHEATEREKRAAEGRVITPQTQVATQEISQSNESAGQSAADKFLEFTNKSWEERVRDLILNTLGTTEEELAAMGPEDRAKMEEKIKEMIKQKIEEDTGISPSAEAV